MPLSDHLPVIDDRRHADLVAEARARIPRYAPEWTDLNDNEPGIAVVQLLAWLSEMLLFRLGQVPQLNRIKFLELIGTTLEPARAASAEITFGTVADFGAATVIVPPRTQVAAEVPGSPVPVVFETEDALVAISAQLDAVLLDSGAEIADVSAANADGITGFAPFGRSVRSGNALMLGFTSDLAFATGPLDLAFFTRAPAATGRKSTPLVVPGGGAAPQAPATLAWDYWNGSEWIALDVLAEETLAFTRSGHVLLQLPASNAPAGPPATATMGLATGARYWLRVRITAGAYTRAPVLAAVRTNTTRALQAQTVDAELIGRATGLDDQVYRLANAPVLDGSLVLQVDEGPGFETWTEVPDFFASGPEDRHYVLDRSTGEVRFGRGTQLRVPMANPNRPSNLLALSYRFGGGAVGNVPAGAINALRASVPGIDSDAVANLQAAGGGTDEESLEAAEERARQQLKSRERAVTAEDFELHAKGAGAARALALPLSHPDFPGLQVPGVVSVVVVPPSKELDPLADPAPQPTEALLHEVCAELDARRLLTTELYVVAPRYREVVIGATLSCRAGTDTAAVKQRAQAALATWLHPLVGGDDASGWPFGGDLYHSALVQRLLLPGVRRVNDLRVWIDGVEQPACSDVEIAPGVLLSSGAHQLSVVTER
ncbi:putative baseplate assembly protein [Sphaerotilus microaerophilus]|uniref:Baseplate assembly protein n=1 Tax=Sphaerotilus microaerophilus TaxID=2914710 RepID=A0ABN6PL32_9BURK|nr:putative baseplate assembly protein [Sphaerotilus sp. FB-5]BDI05911.1 putative baseplate assembly protein [Sphaerotilus sp. FB-5]